MQYLHLAAAYNNRFNLSSHVVRSSGNEILSKLIDVLEGMLGTTWVLLGL